MATYIKPGVYSQFQETAGTVILGAGARIAAFVGTSYTYKIAEDTITRGGVYPAVATSDALPGLPSGATVNEILSVGDTPWASDYTENIDFQILTSTTIDWSLGGDTPTGGNKYYVRYKYNKPTTDYAAQLLYSDSAAKTAYGQPKSDNPLGIALDLYFDNGPAPVAAVQVTEDTTQAFKDAIDKLKYAVGGEEVTHLIVLSTNSEIRSYLVNHVDVMSSMVQRKERRALVSTAISTTEASMKAVAEALANSRMIYIPQWGKKSLLSATTGAYEEFTMDGTYFACSIIGKAISQRIEESLIGKSISGFTELSKVYLEEEADTLAEKGILLLETTGGLIKVRHDMTTAVDTPENNQWSIGEIQDFLIKNIRKALQVRWIGKSIYGGETVNNVAKTVGAVLEKMIESKVITRAGNIVAIQNSGDPRRIDVSFDFVPVYPLVWIYITFSYSSTL